MTHTAQYIFKILHGQWSFTRLASTGEKTSGNAQFSAHKSEEDTLTYHEEGDGFYQDYFYRLKGKDITIYDKENKKMLNLSFDNENKGRGDYICVQDTYHAEFVLNGNNAFTLIYTVKGPKKDYTIKTVFQRIS